MKQEWSQQVTKWNQKGTNMKPKRNKNGAKKEPNELKRRQKRSRIEKGIQEAPGSLSTGTLESFLGGNGTLLGVTFH